MRSCNDVIYYIIYTITHNNSNNCSSIWASWVPEDHIQTPMGCNKEGILAAGKRILTLTKHGIRDDPLRKVSGNRVRYQP